MREARIIKKLKGKKVGIGIIRSLSKNKSKSNARIESKSKVDTKRELKKEVHRVIRENEDPKRE